MKIRAVEVFPFSIPYHSVTVSGAAVSEGTNRVLVRVETDNGIEGVGEAPMFQAGLPETIREVVVPALIGEDPHAIELILQKVLTHLSARLYERSLMLALAPAEIALWDIIGKAAGLPVYQLLGGMVRSKAAMAGIVFSGKPESRAEQSADLVHQGFQTVKMKVGVDVFEDIEGIRAVRASVGPSVELRVDPNQTWTVGTAKRVLKQIEDCDLQYIEQPIRLSDLRGLADLRNTTRTPIAVNESAYIPSEVLEVIRHRCADVILVDPMQAGGLLIAKKICAMADAAGLPVCLHTSADTSIGLSAHLHLVASTPNAIYATDTLFYQNAEDMVKEPILLENGFCQVPRKPGLGVELDHSALYRAVQRGLIRRDWVRPWI